jgi:starch phosphorylase
MSKEKTMTNEVGQRLLPKNLRGLEELALDMRWTGSQTMSQVWRHLDADAWERTRNPWMILLHAHQDRIDELSKDKNFVKSIEKWWEWRTHYLEKPRWYENKYGDSKLKGIAYFSMEFGLSEALPIYSGGLGILAGDHLKSASDVGVPLVGIGLLYQQGYFRQVLGPDGRQLEALPYNDPGSMPVTSARGPDGRRPRVRLQLPGRTLFLRVWEVTVGRVKLYLLDSNDPMNRPWDRAITANLYAAGPEKRLLQELVLGVGGWRLLNLLEIDVDVCHLNEGHAAFAVLARAADFATENGLSFDVALRATRAGNVFTTHTPVEAAFDRFDPGMLEFFTRPLLAELGLSLDRILALGRVHHPHDPSEPFNMAYLAMRGCSRINGVARLHGAVSRRLFGQLYPGRPLAETPVSHITNGVHVPTWDSNAANELFGKITMGHHWTENLEQAVKKLDSVSDAALWDFRAKARKTLVEYVRRRLVYQLEARAASDKAVERARHVLDPNALTLGFARRFTGYKRPTLLLHDAERLARILKDHHRPVQLLVAGKAHPNDAWGKNMVKAVAHFSARDDLRDRVVFLEDYDMTLSAKMTGGVDVWINAPRRPNEACGTSGMKTIVNGGLNLSILDGWWDEAYAPDLGYMFGDGVDSIGDERDGIEADQLYWMIENVLVQEFYNRNAEGVPEAWISKVRQSMKRLTVQFSSDRMVQDYVEKAYLPAAEKHRNRTTKECKLAKELEDWRQAIRLNWRGMRFVSVNVSESNENYDFAVQVYLGDVKPDLVRVELYADPREADDDPAIIELEHKGTIPGTHNGHLYGGSAPADRPAEYYTPRIQPWHPEAILPLEASEVYWKQ